MEPVATQGSYTHVLLRVKDEANEIKHSINYKMVRKGFARFTPAEGLEVDGKLKEAMLEAEEYAEEKKLGIWKTGGVFDE